MRLGYYVARIVAGEDPAEMPFQLPRKFEFVINLRTAAALGIEIPLSVMIQATDVIE